MINYSKKHSLIAASLLAIFLTGCARTAHLYPANNSANATGVLDAHFMSYGSGHGEVEIDAPDGEVLKGEYSIVRGGITGFGSIFGAVYGKNGAAAGFAANTTHTIEENGSPGTVSAYGNKGTSLQCEFYNDNSSGHGYGGCKSSKGLFYRLQY